MAYADLVASDEYQSKYAGAAIEVVIVDIANPGSPIIGATAGINPADDFETVPIEEAGNDGVDEIVQGRHSGAMTIPAFFSPQYNDSLPTRQDFIGKTYTIYQRIAPGRPQAGAILNVWTGAKLQRYGIAQAARGALTVDLSFAFERRYKGEEWAVLAGA